MKQEISIVLFSSESTNFEYAQNIIFVSKTSARSLFRIRNLLKKMSPKLTCFKAMQILPSNTVLQV